jgi:processive 1,2-diacylglycerol beta-glucosyltransferase
MVNLYDKESGTLLGTLTEEQFRLLQDQLEEESPDDDDYYLNRETVELLQGAGADAELLGLLQRALGDREDCEIRWSRD